ncbi:cytochrome P460 family protein [Luteolibacter arcticus]|uniref:Cytochrome P460 family protein n=1 Tax=Luteolibacter arcticus TaxID=1581411 RepID=A0ABT3GCV6_9BACT|nr:cytochrome P460 family protein [Luteolibacter arcticus]MCW1921465.1 cytochrome P460 family protein [Luteolibacter arcticus]
MRAIVCFIFLGLPVGAAPTDEELLAFVKKRAALERVTPQAFDMSKAVAARCSIDAVLLPSNPHAAAKSHVFANDPAALPIFDPWGKFPEGSLIVKEKLGAADGKTQLFTGMWKREKGYFPECGDWEFFTVDGAATKLVERGKLAQCASCHERYVQGDYVSKIYASAAQLSGGRIVLHASKAQVHGKKLQYEPQEKKNTLGFWVDAADHASWSFDVTRPGRFEVHVWQGCGKGSGGSEVEISAAGQGVRFTVEDTGHFQNFKERQVGTLSFEKAGPQKLEVRALSKPGAAVMDLRQMVLVPVP